MAINMELLGPKKGEEEVFELEGLIFEAEIKGQMTKLEELKAAADAAYDSACDKIDAGLCDDEAEAVFSDRWDDFHDAQDAYFAELLKKQEENE
jgi:hypothetical protein